MRRPIYLDNHATTPVDRRVVDAMLPYLTTEFGNASSVHHEYGWRAQAAVEHARKSVASLVGAQPREIVFTSGATESINLALKGVAGRLGRKGSHIVTAVSEHKAVLDTCRVLEAHGFRVTYLPVDRYGSVHPEDVEGAITPETVVVSIMTANNEIGTISPVRDIGGICRRRGVLFHTDATQAAGKVRMDVTAMDIDLLSFSAHKMYGPKGVGALYFMSGDFSARLTPQIDGGGHERGLRSGTLNVPGIVGFGEAARIAQAEMDADAARVGELRDLLVRGIMARVDAVRVNGHPVSRLPHNASLTFEGTVADRVMMDMKDIAVSSGSACSSALPEPSHVLRAIGLNDADVRATLRFGLGRFTTREEIEYAIDRVARTVVAARSTATVAAG